MREYLWLLTHQAVFLSRFSRIFLFSKPRLILLNRINFVSIRKVWIIRLMYTDTDRSTAPAVSHSNSRKIQTTWRTDTNLSVMRWLKVIEKTKFLRSTQIMITSIYCLRFFCRHSCPNRSTIINRNIQTDQKRVFWGITTELLETYFYIRHIFYKFCIRYITGNDWTVHSISRTKSFCQILPWLPVDSSHRFW